MSKLSWAMENSLCILTVFFISNLPKASHLYLKSYWKRGFSDSRGLGASTEHGSFLALVGGHRLYPCEQRIGPPCLEGEHYGVVPPELGCVPLGVLGGLLGNLSARRSLRKFRLAWEVASVEGGRCTPSTTVFCLLDNLQ